MSRSRYGEIEEQERGWVILVLISLKSFLILEVPIIASKLVRFSVMVYRDIFTDSLFITREARGKPKVKSMTLGKRNFGTGLRLEEKTRNTCP